MIPNGSPVSQVQRSDARLPPTSSPLEFASLFSFLCLFARVVNQKSVRKENLSRGWVFYILTSYLRLMTIKQLDHFFVKK